MKVPAGQVLKDIHKVWDDLVWSVPFVLRKLKNRVAAQTARDRKKARMSELEQQVVDLEEEVKILKVKLLALFLVYSSLVNVLMFAAHAKLFLSL